MSFLLREAPVGSPLSATYRLRFGSWNKALCAAGLPGRPRGTRGVVELEEVGG